MSDEIYKIYKLIDPIDNSIRYVGLTINSLKQRLKSHRNERSKSHKTFWIQSLKAQGKSPIIELIETTDSYELACEKEIYWIDKLKSDGNKLTNHASGGNKNKKMSDEVRLKMSLAQKERHKKSKLIITEETKRLMSEKRKELMQNPDNREKLRKTSKIFEESKSQERKLQDILIQNRKEVIQYDLDMNPIKEFPSIKQACRELNIHSANVTKCCNLKVSTVGGFVWRYKGDTRPMRQDKRKKKSVNYIDHRHATPAFSFQV